MTTKYKQCVTIFIGLCCVSALIGWLTGYDFDYRSDGVAVWVFFTLLFSGYLAALITAYK